MKIFIRINCLQRNDKFVRSVDTEMKWSTVETRLDMLSFFQDSIGEWSNMSENIKTRDSEKWKWRKMANKCANDETFSVRFAMVCRIIEFNRCFVICSFSISVFFVCHFIARQKKASKLSLFRLCFHYANHRRCLFSCQFHLIRSDFVGLSSPFIFIYEYCIVWPFQL